MSNTKLRKTLEKLSSISMSAKDSKSKKYISLAHHLKEELLKDCCYNLARNKAVGIDKVSWQEYEKDLDKNLKSLVERLKKNWKDFYLVPLKESKYHKLLGKSLMLEKDFDTLLNIGYFNKKYIYQFKNHKITTNTPPLELFNKYGYDKMEVKTAPMVSVVQDKIMGVVRRF